METGTKESAARGRKRMFTLWGQHKTKCCRSEANIHLKLEQVSWNISRRVLLNNAFQTEIVKEQFSDFSLSMLVKRL